MLKGIERLHFLYIRMISYVQFDKNSCQTGPKNLYVEVKDILRRHKVCTYLAKAVSISVFL